MDSISKENNKMLRRIAGVASGIDRISDLPDPILCKIISDLSTKSTKNAVATKILSKRWKHLFPSGVSPINLAFNDTDLLQKGPSTTMQTLFGLLDYIDLDSFAHFRRFVDKILLYHTSLDVPPRVESMNLSCRKVHGIGKILSWIGTALQLGVQTLILEFSLDDLKGLVDTLNGCSTLVSLSMTLKLSCEKTTTYFVPDNFNLPNLKKLWLSGVVFDDDEGDDDGSIGKWLKGCPVLEDLSFVRCEFRVAEVIVIQSELLKCLTIDSDKYAGYSLDLDAPNLQVFIFKCAATRTHRISDFKSLSTAYIDTQRSTMPGGIMYYGKDPDRYVLEGIAQLVSACSSTTRLHLTSQSIYALCAPYVHDSSVQLPEFHNLTGLKLGSLAPHGWALLAQLLHNSPNLKELSFEEDFEVSKISEDNRGYADFEHLVLHPPMCLELHVKRIEFCVFNCRDEESKLLAYFLKNGKVLEKVILRCLPSVINVLNQSIDPRIMLEPR